MNLFNRSGLTFADFVAQADVIATRRRALQRLLAGDASPADRGVLDDVVRRWREEEESCRATAEVFAEDVDDDDDDTYRAGVGTQGNGFGALTSQVRADRRGRRQAASDEHGMREELGP